MWAGLCHQSEIGSRSVVASRKTLLQRELADFVLFAFDVVCI
jgi:hypothetical protein